MRLVIPEHLRKRHSINSCTIWVSPALEQRQRISISAGIIEPLFRAVKEQRITGGIRSIRRHRRIHIGAPIEEQIKARSSLIRVIAQIPIHEDHGLSKLIKSI